MSENLPNNPAVVGPYRCGKSEPLMVIAGPCVLENEGLTLSIARRLRELNEELPVNIVFKASFDKANRTSLNAFRGVGLERGMDLLAMVREETGLPVTTDIHETHHAAVAGKVCDLLQIPAFLARQTDLLIASAETGKAVNVKKGQFMAPADMQHVVTKLTESNCPNVLLTERGTFFGYGRLVNDMRALVQMRQWGTPIVFDATHSVQEPGGLGGKTGGNREMVEPLARAAVAVGVDALFFETHPHPEASPSDGPNMISLDAFPDLLRRLIRLHEAALEQ